MDQLPTTSEEQHLPKTREEWSKLEASFLTTGCFMLLPMPIHEASSDDNKSIRLWRKVLDMALVDFLRGPLGNILPEPLREDPFYDKKYLKYLNSIRESRKIYRDVVNWLYGAKTISQELESNSGASKSEHREIDGDFISVCDLAYLDPSTVKSAFLKLYLAKYPQNLGEI